MIAIVDYGVGNLFSVGCSLRAIGADAVVTSDKNVIEKADKILLPGVGAFRDAADKLEKSGLGNVIINEVKEKNKPLLGICLGMQLLFEKSYEYGEYDGLGLIKGCIRPINDVIPKNLSVPHMGWNRLDFKKDTPIFKYINNGDEVYFVHSYYAAECDESVTATAEYGAEITASVQRDNIFGCQFHPEKSGNVGLNILRAFAQI